MADHVLAIEKGTLTISGAPARTVRYMTAALGSFTLTGADVDLATASPASLDYQFVSDDFGNGFILDEDGVRDVLTWKMKTNDTAPAMWYRLPIYESGSAILTGATVRFIMRPVGSEIAKIDNDAEIPSAVSAGGVSYAGSDGVLQYQWVTGDTDTAGEFSGEFEVTLASGKVRTFPPEGYIRLNFTEDLG